MSGCHLYLAKPSTAPIPAAPLGDVVHAMLDARLAASATAPALVTLAAGIVRRALHFDISGAYWVAPERATLLSLAATEGLPSEFADVARTLPLSDYDQVADLPYNDEHGSCYGDFFAPVVGAFGIRSWLVASLTDPNSQAVTGAILLGSRDGGRFGSDETRLVLSLAAVASAHLAACSGQENDYGLASLDMAA